MKKWLKDLNWGWLAHLGLSYGALTWLVVLAICGLSGLVVFSEMTNILYTSEVSQVPSQLSSMIDQTVERQTKRLIDRWKSGDLAAEDFTGRSVVKAVWAYVPNKKLIKVVTSDGFFERPSDGKNWVELLGGFLKPPAYTIGVFPAGFLKDFENLTNPAFHVVSSPLGKMEMMVMTNIGAGGELICGIVIDPVKFREQLLIRQMRLQTNSNHMVLAWFDREGVNLWTNDGGQISEAQGREFGEKSPEMEENGLSGILSGTRLRIYYNPNIFGNIKTKHLVFLLLLAIVPGLILFGMIASSYIFGKKEAEGLQLKNDWILSLAHSLRGPIHSVGLLTEALEAELAQNPSEKTALIHRELSGMDRSTVRFIRLARNAHQSMTSELEEVHLPTLLSEITEKVQLRYPQGKDIKFTIEPSPVSSINADRETFSEILETIIDNAVKFSSDSGEIKISIIDTEGSILVKISDQGLGIDQSDLSRIGELFFQAGTDKTEGITGNGIGLYLAKKLVESMSGKLTFASEGPGKGTAVEIEFPKIRK